MTRLASTLTVAILAGGEGRRVGGDDKGWLMLGGIPLIERVVSHVREQADAILICANRRADDYARLGSVIADSRLGFHGPLAGIASALARCASPWLLTVPVDAPEPPFDLAQRLHAAVIAHAADVAVAHDGAQRQPLFALYRRELAQSAATALDAGMAVYRWQENLGAVAVDFADRAPAFANLNTMNAFREWEQCHVD